VQNSEVLDILYEFLTVIEENNYMFVSLSGLF
jgi:hypothetical protein